MKFDFDIDWSTDISCAKCGRVVHLGELITWVGIYFAKKLGPIIVPVIIAALKDYFAVPKKGNLDHSVSLLANKVRFDCPSCKKKNCWNPTTATFVPVAKTPPTKKPRKKKSDIVSMP